MLDDTNTNFKNFFARTPEGKELRTELWEDNKGLVAFCVGALFLACGLGFGYSILSDMQEELDAEKARATACYADVSDLRLKDFDVETQKRLTEKAQADLAAKQTELAAAAAMIKSLEHELDLDDDGVGNDVDKCPDSKFTEGGPTAVNTFGCSELQAADSCLESSERIPGEFEQYIWSNCSLSDKPNEVDYTCAATLVDGAFKATECHETPYTITDGVKSYGG